MSATVPTPAPDVRTERLARIWAERPGLVGWLTTTDHKRIGLMYLFASLAFFAAGGVEALLIRTQLIGPDLHVLGPQAFDEAFTMHGVTMIFLFVIPISMGAFGNYLLPLQIGARDMAFPRLNALSFWIFVASGLFMYAGVAVGRAPSGGWFNYVPLASRTFSPDKGIDFYALGLIFNSTSTVAGAVNFIVTIFRLRAPGMALNRMPLFCYAFLAVSFAVVFALPTLTVACLFLELDRQLGFHFYDVAQGGDPLLWQHLFWIFGHPEVYIIILPAFGIATSIIPTFVRRRMVAFPLVAVAELLVAFIGFGVWAHHMFAVGLPTATVVYFAAASLIIVIPSGIQLFAWIMTILTGTPTFRVPLLWIIGFIVMFLIGGLTGVMFAAIPFDQQLTDSYFVVAHFHFVIFGAAVFPILAGLHFWFPKVTGRMYREGPALVGFALTTLGTLLTFFPMHIVGLLGMPRRIYTYDADRGWTVINLLESIGAYILAAGLITIFVNLVLSLRRGVPAGNDPWGAPTLEWATTSPPPAYNFAVIPTVSSPYPMWDREEHPRGLVLEQGHETPSTTPLDAELDAVLEMPSESWAPLGLAAALAAMFTMLLLAHWVTAAIFAGLAAVALALWHAHEPAEPRVVQRPGSRPSGWWGMVLLIAGEATLLAAIVGSYYYLRFQNPQWPPHGVSAPDVALPLVLTAVLVSTSVPMALAARAGMRGRAGLARRLLVAALVVQVAYLAVQAVLFGHDLDSFSPRDHAYGSVYFTMLGAHHAHVLAGVLLSAGVALKLLGGLNRYRLTGLRATAAYWHFVNAAAVIVVLTQLSVSL